MNGLSWIKFFAVGAVVPRRVLARIINETPETIIIKTVDGFKFPVLRDNIVEIKN